MNSDTNPLPDNFPVPGAFPRPGSGYVKGTTRKVRVPKAERLRLLGIAAHELEAYKALFVPVYGRCWYRKAENQPFYPLKNRTTGGYIRLDDYLVLKHLQGILWIARTMARYTDSFWIDIDHNGSDSSLRRRYDQVVQAFRVNPILFRSSASNGLHLCYFTSYSPRESLGRCLSDFLAGKGMELDPGTLEAFPGNVDHMRLPLGRGSHLLDPVTLHPLGLDLKSSISFVQEGRHTSFVDLDTLDPHPLSWVKTNRNLHENQRTYHRLHSYTGDFTEHPLYIRQILQSRLEYGQRHEVEMKLVYYCMGVLDLSEEKTFAFIWEYLLLPGHRSKDLEKSHDLVKQYTWGLIRNFARKKHRKSAAGFLQTPLGRADAEFVLRETGRLRVRNKYGHEALAMQRLMFRLFQFFKSKKTIELDLPRTLLWKWSSHRRVATQLEQLCTWGVLTLVSESDYLQRKARRYRLNYKPGSSSDFLRWEECIQALLGESIPSHYTRGLYPQLRSPLGQVQKGNRI